MTGCMEAQSIASAFLRAADRPYANNCPTATIYYTYTIDSFLPRVLCISACTLTYCIRSFVSVCLHMYPLSWCVCQGTDLPTNYISYLVIFMFFVLSKRYSVVCLSVSVLPHSGIVVSMMMTRRRPTQHRI